MPKFHSSDYISSHKFSISGLMLYVIIRIMVKWLNLPYPNSLSFWENRYFIIVSEQEILSLILVSILPLI